MKKTGLEQIEDVVEAVEEVVEEVVDFPADMSISNKLDELLRVKGLITENEEVIECGYTLDGYGLTVQKTVNHCSTVRTLFLQFDENTQLADLIEDFIEG